MQANGSQPKNIEGTAKLENKIPLLPGMASHASLLMPAHTSRFLAIAGSIPANEKRALDEAVLKCPELVSAETDSRKFLQVADNDFHAAGRRMVEYWNQRVRLFGENAHKPLIQGDQGALSSTDIFLLKEGFITHPGCTVDDVPIICLDVAKCTDFTEDRLRGAFYASHHIACLPEAHLTGVVLLLILADFEMQQNDLLTQFIKLVRGAIPLKLQSVHCIFTAPAKGWPDSVPEDAIFQLDLKELQDAGILHTHFKKSDAEIVQKLGEIGITPECLPEAAGGSYVHKEGLETHSVWKSFECERSRLKSTKGWPELKFRATGPELKLKRTHAHDQVPSIGDFAGANKEVDCTPKQQKSKHSTEDRNALAGSEDATEKKCSSESDIKMGVTLFKTSEPIMQATSFKTSEPLNDCTLDSSDVVDGVKICKKRQMNIIYSKRKREKKKQQIEALQTQHYDVSNENVALKRENIRLEKLVSEAIEAVEKHEQAAKRAVLDRFNVLQPNSLTHCASAPPTNSTVEALLATLRENNCFGRDCSPNDPSLLAGEVGRSQSTTLINSLLGSNTNMFLPSAPMRSRQDSELLRRMIHEEAERRKSLILRPSAESEGQRLLLRQTVEQDALLRRIREEALLARLRQDETPDAQLIAQSLVGASLSASLTRGLMGAHVQGQQQSNPVGDLSRDMLNQLSQISGINERFLDNPDILEALRGRFAR